MRKKMVLVLAITIFLLASNMAAASGIIGKTLVGYTKTDSGLRAYVTVVDADNVGGLQLSLEYDPKVITADSIENGSIISGETNISKEIDNTNGKITLRVGNPNGFTGSGSVAGIIFKNVGVSGDTTDLNLTVLDADSPDQYPITVSNVTDATYTIGATTTPTVTTPGVTTPEETPEVTTPEVTTPEVTTPEETTETPVATTTPRTPGFGALLSVAAILMALINYRRK